MSFTLESELFISGIHFGDNKYHTDRADTQRETSSLFADLFSHIGFISAIDPGYMAELELTYRALKL